MIHESLDRLAECLGQTPIDLFICSASFESRCRSIVDHFSGVMPIKSLVAASVRSGDGVDGNCRYLKDVLGAGAELVEVDNDSPIFSADSIVRSVGRCLRSQPKRIVIDTTTFTRESLLILLRFLRYMANGNETVEFLYAHAREYSVGDPPEDKWLSKGIREVRSVLGYSGDLLPSRRNHLVILVGFEDERALNLINQFEPARISLGVGDRSEPGTGPHQEINISKCAKLKGILENITEFTFKAYDAKATWQRLREQALDGDDFNVVIAPMNTKISTIGAAMFAMEHEAIQLCYAQPNLYNYDRYSVPDEDFYLFTVDGFPK